MLVKKMKTISLVSLLLTVLQIVLSLQQQLTTGGSTVAKPAIEALFAAYQQQAPDATLSYANVGSGAGLLGLLGGDYLFAFSETPFSQNEKQEQVELRTVPLFAAGVSLPYHLPGVNRLVLDSEAVAGIFNGSILYWDDEMISRLQEDPMIDLPHERIVKVARSDSSGTTSAFTSYLSIISEEWSREYGVRATWPEELYDYVNRVRGTSDVFKEVLENPYSIGYSTPINLLNRTNEAYVVNRAGVAVNNSIETLLSAVNLHAISFNFTDMNHLESVLNNEPGEMSYPIADYTYLVFYEDTERFFCNQVYEAQRFFQFIYSSSEASSIIEKKGFVPFRNQRVMEIIESMKCNGRIFTSNASSHVPSYSVVIVTLLVLAMTLLAA